MLQLEADMKSGRTRSLRDLGSLLDSEEQKLNVHQLLKDYTIFLPTEFDLSKDISKQDFLEFYYENAGDFKYSELLNAFYLTPLEFRDPEFSMRPYEAASETDRALLLRRLVLDYQAALKANDSESIERAVGRIYGQDSEAGYRFLLEVLQKDILQNKDFPDRKKIAGQVANAVANYPTTASMDLLLECAEAGLLTPNLTAGLLSYLTNHQPVQRDDAALLAKNYRHLRDSLGGFAEMRQAGYAAVYSFGKNSFEFPVDYYGRVLALSEQRPWLRHNALKDLVATKHPRALFYLAAQVWQYRDRLDLDKEEFVYRLKNLTELEVAVEGRKGKSYEQNRNGDRTAQLNYVTYWAAHYEDYEWDEIRNHFINKTEKLELTENYERLFRRLNSRSDTVAMQAWLLLAEGDPVEVIGLANKYKELLRNYNPTLPSFKYRYLEQTVQLTDFCKRNKIRYNPSSRLQYRLEKLANSESEKERYAVENRLIASLTTDEITAVEYWGLLNESNKEISFSVGRILDWYYSENWDKIINDETQLRLYLKKAKLFGNIGVIGVCNHYMNKFGSLYPQLEERLKNLLQVETDPDIIESIDRLFAGQTTDYTEVLPLFIENPLTIAKEISDKLPAPSRAQIEHIFAQILQSESAKEKRVFLDYLEIHADLQVVPGLIVLLQNEVESKQVTGMLEKIYNHRFDDKAAGWSAVWEKDQKNYQKWEKKFFNEKIKTIPTQEIVDVKNLNEILKSKYYVAEKHKDLVLSALPRLKSVRYVRRFRTEEPLQMPDDLRYFENLNLSEKELDDVPRLFELKNPKPMVAFLVQQAKKLDLEARGSFYNNLFRSNWFTNYVNDGRLSKLTASYIRDDLETYLNESDLISEFEEQATLRNIALLDISNLPLEEKIYALLRLQAEVGEDAAQQVQKAILSRVDYEDLSQIAPFFQELSVLSRYNFLNKDFGLPIFDLRDRGTADTLKLIHQKYYDAPEKFYAYYLDGFGVDYKNESGAIDYTKIYRILKYDIVTPFVGDGGNRRDYFTYGIVKLLEKEFDTRLGFHPKLNENQTFYSFSAAKRAAAWMDYLELNSLVDSVSASQSFNK